MSKKCIIPLGNLILSIFGYYEIFGRITPPVAILFLFENILRSFGGSSIENLAIKNAQN